MQIKDLELSRELSAEEQAAVEGGRGGRARDRIAQVKQENIADQFLKNTVNVANGSEFTGDNVLITVNNDVDQSSDQHADSDVDQH
jgi:hypothetical protein